MIIRADYVYAEEPGSSKLLTRLSKDGKVIDQAFYDKAKDLYLEAFYRVIYIGVKNSTGFHNRCGYG